MRRSTAWVLLLLGALSMISCAEGPHVVTVTNERIGRPSGPNAVMYFTATSNGADRLLGASTLVATSVQIHETISDDHGATGMHPLEQLDVGDGEELVLEPGSFHLMLIGVDRLEVGESAEVTLHWEKAGDMSVEAVVVPPQDALGSDG